MSRNASTSQRLGAPSGALAQFASPSTSSASGELSFRMQDADLSSHAVMNSSFTSTRNNDLLAQDFNASDPLKIDFDTNTFFFNHQLLPKDIGKSLLMTVGNGKLLEEYGTQLLDVAPEFRAKIPVGNHDLLETTNLVLKTTYRRGFIAEFKTISALGNEHFFGNSHDSNSKSAGAKTVRIVVLPTDLDANGCISIPIISRKITQPMLQFLARFPNQTADTIDKFVTPVDKNQVFLHFSPINNKRPTSCVSLWHASYQGSKTELIENDQGMASMDRSLYDSLAAQAKLEIPRHISLGDVTSPNFGIEIFALPVNGTTSPDLGSFATQFPGVDENMLVEDKWGREMTALELFEKTPLEWTGRITNTYRKINDS